MRYTPLILFLLLALTRLHAQTCLPSFAGLTPGDEKSAAIVVKTYRDLLDTVKDPATKEKWLALIEARQDPFAVPTDSELSGPHRHLKTFKEMLEKLGYSKAATRDLLLPAIAGWRVELGRALREQRLADLKNAKDVTFPLPPSQHYSVSPDRRYLVGADRGRFWLIHTETGEVTAGPPAPPDSTLNLSHDGKAAYVGEGETLFVYDRNGDNFTLRHWIAIPQSLWGMKEKRMAEAQPIPLANPNWVVTEFFHKDGGMSEAQKGLWLINVNTSEVKKLESTDGVRGLVGRGSFGSAWTVAPGTNRIFIRWLDGDSMRNQYADINENGEVSEWKTVGLTQDSGTGPGMLWATHDRLAVRSSATLRAVTFFTLEGQAPLHVMDHFDKTKPTAALFHPDGKTAIVSFEGQYQVVDLEQQRTTAWFRAPDLSWLSPDGERLLSVDREKGLRSLRHQSRQTPTPP